MAQSRIDEQTLVPLSVVAGLFTVGIGVTATGAFWVKSVNDRLAHIENKLGIVAIDDTKVALVPEASAEERK